ncbi:hypothetical protein EV384_2808 [Micromonospora kangleipakensis]|uniref:Uncharacterized protein n=1 Tax=Micromonospora kangleipakensis TaxID=1077942 RepID=A0A4Q8B9D2_9ACTN|nr:hypothetical protein EV384_2808 [Micromonospora kangleipakensis]
MHIPWRTTADVFAQILRRHGVDQDGVTDVEAAWGAFAEFLQLDIDGLDQTPDSDADGFIIQWGRRSWSDNRLILTFTRQLAIADVGDHDDPYWQPELWQLDLEMAFDDEADLIGLDSLDVHDTGFKFAPTGPLRAAALADTWAKAQRHAPVRAAWIATPASSGLSFECVC